MQEGKVSIATEFNVNYLKQFYPSSTTKSSPSHGKSKSRAAAIFFARVILLMLISVCAVIDVIFDHGDSFIFVFLYWSAYMLGFGAGVLSMKNWLTYKQLRPVHNRMAVEQTVDAEIKP